MLLIDAMDKVLDEYQASIDKHGHWREYTTEQMMSVIINELMLEAGSAEQRGDLHGDHGVVRELSQVAACCIKAIMVLSDRTDMNPLAETIRTAGAQSEVEATSLPASPSLHQEEESSSNRPMESRS